jgi:hypothetical protein
MSWLSDRFAWLHAPWTALSDVQADLARHEFALHETRTRMTSMENEAYARAAQVVGLIKAEFASLRGQLDEALAGTDAAVESALSEDSARDAERLTGLIDELSSVLPADVPDVPVPAPGEPAELPTDAGDGDAGEPAPVDEVAGDPADTADPADDGTRPA